MTTAEYLKTYEHLSDLMDSTHRDLQRACQMYTDGQTTIGDLLPLGRACESACTARDLLEARWGHLVTS